jgi:hypothetical protein
MNLKRKVLVISLLAIVWSAFISACQQPAKEIASVEKVKENPVDMVYPFLDAANSRWFLFS